MGTWVTQTNGPQGPAGPPGPAGASFGQSAASLLNGLNSSVATGEQSSLRLSGPTGAFSIGGLHWVGPTAGQQICLINTTTEPLTIVNEDLSSTAADRIRTPTGQDFALPVGQKSQCFLTYDGTLHRWILQASIRSTNEVNVKDFGAVGDGVTNDTAALQAALTFCQSSGALLVLQANHVYGHTIPLTYTGSVGAALRMSGGVGCDRGGSQGAVIKYIGGSVLDGPQLHLLGVNGMTLEHVDFDANAGALYNVLYERDPLGVQTTENTIDRCFFANVTTVARGGGIANVTNNGSGAIRITTHAANGILSSAAGNSGQMVRIAGVLGTGGLAANGTWTVQQVDATNFDLIGSTFAGAYTSGGTVNLLGVNFEVGGNNDATDTTVWRDCIFLGDNTNGGADAQAGWRARSGGNTKDFSLQNCNFSNMQYGIDWYNASGALHVEICGYSGILLDENRIGATGVTATFDNCRVENAAPSRFVVSGGIATTANSVSINNLTWNGTLRDDGVVASYAGFLSIEDSEFYGSGGALGYCRVQCDPGNVNGAAQAGGFVSRGNFYQGATNYLEVLDFGNNLLAGPPNKGAGILGVQSSVRIQTFADYGGTPGSFSRLAPWLGTGHQIGDQMPNAIENALAATTGQTISYLAKVSGGIGKITLGFQAWKIAGGPYHVFLQFPARTRVKSIILDVTTGFAGVTTPQLSAGNAVGGVENNYLVAFDASAPTTKGLVAADLGTVLASPVQGGDIASWAGSNYISIRLSAATSLANLTAGSVDLYYTTETFV